MSCGALETFAKASILHERTHADGAIADKGLDGAAGTFWTQSMQVGFCRACAGKILMQRELLKRPLHAGPISRSLWHCPCIPVSLSRVV